MVSNSTASKKKRLRRTSSSTLGRIAAQLVGLPPDGQHLAQLGEQHAAAHVADPRVVEAVQQRRDVPLVVEHRAPRGLGRMRGEDVLDLQLRGQRRDVDRAVAQDLRRLAERLALDLAGAVVLAPAADALALLGDVRQLQLQRAGADDRLDGLVGDLAQVGDETVGRGLVARADGRGGAEEPLHARGEHAAGLLLEHAVERGREQFGVLGETVWGRRGCV